MLAKQVSGIIASKFLLQYSKTICTCSILQKRDKYSLKNIGSKRASSAGGRKGAPSYKRYGGSKEFPVTLFKLPSLSPDEMEPQGCSRHKLMVENALKTAIESLIFSGIFSNVLAGCPLEITKVDLSTNFASAVVSWRLDALDGSIKEDEIQDALDQDIEFIRSMLPAYHSMTSTPLVTFQQDLTIEKDRQIDEALKFIQEDDTVQN